MFPREARVRLTNIVGLACLAAAVLATAAGAQTFRDDL
jgi:hypothetical protein